MLFGFALAVIVGFLFTAGRNWTNQPTPTGAPLAALALLWVAARVLVLTPFGWAAAAANVAFPLAAAIALARPLLAARNRRNYFFVGLLLLMAAAALAVHLQLLGVLALPGLGRHPAGAGRGAVHHGGDGRPRDADVHQQRRAGRPGHAPPALERLALGSVLVLLVGRPAAAARRRCWPRSPPLAAAGPPGALAAVAAVEDAAHADRLGAACGLPVDSRAPGAARRRRSWAGCPRPPPRTR